MNKCLIIRRVENIVVKGEIANYKQLILFATLFSKVVYKWERVINLGFNMSFKVGKRGFRHLSLVVQGWTLRYFSHIYNKQAADVFENIWFKNMVNLCRSKVLSLNTVENIVAKGEIAHHIGKCLNLTNVRHFSLTLSHIQMLSDASAADDF